MALEERYESKESVPEALREHYIEVTEGDKTEFVLENVVNALNAKRHVKEELNQFKSQQSQQQVKMQEQLDALQAKEREAEQAKQEALEAKLKQDGKLDELLALEQEKRESVRKSLEEQLAAERSKLETFQTEIASEKAKSAAAEIASKIGTAETSDALRDLIMLKRIKIADSQPVILGKDGAATEMTVEQLAEDVKNDPYFKHLVAGVQSGGGQAQGGMKPGGASFDPNMPYAKMNPAQKAEFLKRKKG